MISGSVVDSFDLRASAYGGVENCNAVQKIAGHCSSPVENRPTCSWMMELDGTAKTSFVIQLLVGRLSPGPANAFRYAALVNRTRQRASSAAGAGGVGID